MWLLYDILTGEQIGEWTEVEPEPQEGQAVAPVVASAAAGISAWSPVLRGFVEPVVLARHEIRALFTQAEWIAAEAVPLNASFDMQARATMAALLRALSMVDALRIDEPYFVNGLPLWVQLGVLTPARAAQALAGLPAST